MAVQRAGVPAGTRRTRTPRCVATGRGVPSLGRLTCPRPRTNIDVLALQSGVHGDVRLMVILQADGSIRAIRLLASSGNPRLDEAAKNSVRRAAPFAPFDARMRNLSELRIIRTWRFAAQQDQLDVRGR